MKVALGLGCDRDTPIATVVRAIDEALAEAGVTLADVAAVATIDRKSDEVAFIELAKEHDWTMIHYRAEELAGVPVPHPSEVVMKYVGTPSVAEAAALLAAGTNADGLLVEKHKHKGDDGKHATVSVARMSQ